MDRPKTLDRRQAAVLAAQFKKATAGPNEFIKFALKSDTELNVWYILLSGFSGNDDEFSYEEITPQGKEIRYGEYLCEIRAPEEFPFKPPEFYFLTENGLYEINGKVCISIGEFHSGDYRASLGMAGFAAQLVSGMIGWRDIGSGIRLLNTSIQQKKEFAIKSRMANFKNYPKIMELIDKHYAEYSVKWDLSKVPDQLKEKIGWQFAKSAPPSEISSVGSNTIPRAISYSNTN